MTTYEYDLSGRVTKQTLPGGRVIDFTYDANGNLLSLAPPDRLAHEFNYTAVDLQEQYNPPDIGLAVDATQYVYDLDKRPEQVTRPDGQLVGYEYAGPGQKLSQISIAAGTYTYSYKPTTGQLETLIAPGGQSLAYAYDGALLTAETYSGAIAGSVSLAYDSSFRVTQQSVNGSAIAFTYDNDDLLTVAGSLSLTRNPSNGLVDATTLGNVTSSLSYNSFGELASETTRYSGSVLYQVSYPTRDKLGRMVEKSETIQGESATYLYGYDTAGRLQTVTKDGSLVATYGYDLNGNRTSRNGVTYTYDAQDRLLSDGSASYTYTANGELLTKSEGASTTTYGYDALGNLRTVSLPNGTQIEYLIDGRNRRVGKKVDGALVQGFLYGNQLEPIAELDGAGNVVARFIYAERAHAPSYIVKNGNIYRIISDHLGSPRLIVDAQSAVVAQRIDYDEFGRITLDTAPGFQPFGFAGGLYDRHTQLTRFGARDYYAGSGRWAIKDPILFNGLDPNVYGYVFGDPINFIDDDGLRAVLVRPAPRNGEVFNRGAPFRTMSQQQVNRGYRRYENMLLTREALDRTLQEFPFEDGIAPSMRLEKIRLRVPETRVDALVNILESSMADQICESPDSRPRQSVR